MSKVKVLSRAQITIPEEIRNELHLNPKDIVTFKAISSTEIQISKSSDENSYLQTKATLTAKGQVTIPAEIRDSFKITPGDTLEFLYNGNFYFRRMGNLISCPICNGEGYFKDFDAVCFICDQKKIIEWDEELGIMRLILFSNVFRKYKISMIYQTQTFDSAGKFQTLQFPKLTLNSLEYPPDLLIHIQDELQLLIIKYYAPKSISNKDTYMIPSDVILNEILSLFETEETKISVLKLFR